jgi:ATP-dependent Lon protease
MIDVVAEDEAHDERSDSAEERGGLPAVLPVLPLRETVPLPDTLIPLAVGQDRSVQMVNDVLAGGDRRIVMVCARDSDVEVPGPDDLYTVGVVGAIARMMKIPDGTLRILVQATDRVRITGWESEKPYLVARVERMPDVLTDSTEVTALMRTVQQTFHNIVEHAPYLPEELQLAVANIDDPSALAHLIAGSLRMKVEDKQAMLEEVNVAKRLRMLAQLLARELQVLTIGSEIQSQVQSEIDKGQREYVLRQQLKAIQAELGEYDESIEEARELREQLARLDLPPEVRKQADRELARLEQLPAQAAEHGVIRTYLEWIAALPWGRTTEDNLDLAHARRVLDEDHYDIEQVKDRIIEFLAVRKLRGEQRGDPGDMPTILCFVGPPGVGKTSLGRSIARALGRRFERISVGGMRDEAEIRGHRRTYVGAMPGTIIRALRDAGTDNPLFMIDEIDKMGSDFRGDPSSAMLEVLDPEQNSTFRDHYLDVPYDLSKVMFICTANDLDRIPGPLRDRMEIIQLAGYTQDEKLQIAKRYLVPRQIERNGLRKSWISFGDRALRRIIADYTREAGVRNLERQIGTVCRKVARQIAESGEGAQRPKPKRASVTPELVRELLGRPRFVDETRRRTRTPGVATGLAWTPVGGDVLFVEASATPGDGKLVLTGHLGDVMRESAQAALTYVKGHAGEIAPGLEEGWFAKHDIHLHVPAGATPKDGPSAGITMVTALASLISGRLVRADVAMTGEVTLSGQVLAIGGLKEKALAAQRHGIKTVIAPLANEADAEDIPEHLREKLRFVWVEDVAEVLDAALQR